MAIIYVLKLNHGKYYVDQTNGDLEEEFQKHANNKNCYDWVWMFKPLEIIETFENTDKNEDEITKIYMKKYSIHNVRGGSYKSYRLEDHHMKALKEAVCSTKDFRCQYAGCWPEKCGMVDFFGIAIELSHDYVWFCNNCDKKLLTKTDTENHQCDN